ncbi:BUB protein kinase Bub1 [Schizosaccharomyces cryophilus OY26]|uniref:BUB protein kinase Bub1 n=1 Tax=Schizosaccharomyces cryophilus (strain OY26 / ATCC MYA-4695 / CBS 11777 / NBRC 106824 / NRRL Y48691) TaxID=653667 RepID=S9VRS8_SCHCR|nr:BUB protein kinase Bub1 [Schizosaccharomyces cryophilus OY26]EPY50638.1 BUB protein kinase Bub1 [Schizosaccharomyces cryophilus OY26]
MPEWHSSEDKIVSEAISGNNQQPLKPLGNRLEETQTFAVFQEELEVIDELDDPVDVWYRCVEWLGSTQYLKENTLPKVVEDALAYLEKCRFAQNDVRHLRIWLAKIHRLCASPETFPDAAQEFYHLASKRIGMELALYYEEYTSLLVRMQRWREASVVLQTGVSREARPLNRLLRHASDFSNVYNAYLKKLSDENISLESLPYEPPFPPPRTILGTKASTDATSTSEKLSTVQNNGVPHAAKPFQIYSDAPTPRSEHTLSTALTVPPSNVIGEQGPNLPLFYDATSGKRIEYAAFHFPVLYENGQEKSMEEYRAERYFASLSSSLQAPESQSFPVPTDRPLSSFQNEPLQPTPKKEVFDVLTPVALSPKPALKPSSPTIHTKAALADIMDLFNQPLRSETQQTPPKSPKPNHSSDFGSPNNVTKTISFNELSSVKEATNNFAQPSAVPSHSVDSPYENRVYKSQLAHSPQNSQLFSGLPADTFVNESSLPAISSNAKRRRTLSGSPPSMTYRNHYGSIPSLDEQPMFSLNEKHELHTVNPYLQNEPFTNIHEHDSLVMNKPLEHPVLPPLPTIIHPLDQPLRDCLYHALGPYLRSDENYHEIDSNFTMIEAIESFVSKPRTTPSGRGRRRSNSTRLSLLNSPTFPLTYPPNVKLGIISKLGQGAFAPVYLAKGLPLENELSEKRESDTVDYKLYALKIETPASSLEYYLTLEARRRMSGTRDVGSILPVYYLCMYRNTSHLLMDYRPQGSVLDLVNSLRNTSSSVPGIDEMLVFFFSIELFRIVEGLHSHQIIHGDLKADNALLRLEAVNDIEWDASYSPEGFCGWSSKGIFLIDFGRGLDMSLFDPKTKFMANWETDSQDCIEMREGEPWTYQVDYHGLAAIIHTMLFGQYIETKLDYSGGQRRQVLTQRMKRYWNQELWNRLFDVLLNPTLQTSDGSLPIPDLLKNVRLEMENWLVYHSTSGIGLKGMLKKIEQKLAS